jgi:hypothetical protein
MKPRSSYYIIIPGVVLSAVGALVARLLASSLFFLVLAGSFLIWLTWLLYRTSAVLVEDAPDEAQVALSSRRRRELEREKQSILKALKELEFDHEMRKVSDDDFREIGGQYRLRAIRVLRMLDETGLDYKQLIERDLRAKMEKKRGGPAAEEKPAAADRSHCTCGTRNDVDAEFCKKCGRKLEALSA